MTGWNEHAWTLHAAKGAPRCEYDKMSKNEEENRDISEGLEEALTEAEPPGQVLDPLAEPVGSRGVRRTTTSEYLEEDARERPPEDGLDPELPEDEKLRVSEPQGFEDEFGGTPLVPGRPDEIVEGDAEI
jgi:hypothetical protein